MAPCIAKPIRLCLQQAVQCLLDAASHDLPQMIFYPTGVDTDHVRQALRVILVHGGSGLLYWLLCLVTESLRDSGPPTPHKCAKLSLRHRPLPLPLSEVVPALQSGNIDSMLAGMLILEAFKFYDVAKP